MMRRWRLALLLLLVVAAGAAWLFWPRPDPVTQEAYNRIELGMTLAEVEAIVGLPPGDYYSGPRGPSPMCGPFAPLIQEKGPGRGTLSDGERDGNTIVEVWWGNSHVIEVAVGKDGKVFGCYLSEVTGVPNRSEFWLRVQAWLGF